MYFDNSYIAVMEKNTLTHMRSLALILIVTLPVYASARLPASEERAIYEKDAKEQVLTALSKKPPNALLTRGAVPTEKVAVEIHQAVTSAIYGAGHIQKQKPFLPVRSGEFWVVYGSVPGKSLGGAAVSVIRASNGEVLSVTHQQ
jgi:NTF2 fold immunity protein